MRLALSLLPPDARRMLKGAQALAALPGNVRAETRRRIAANRRFAGTMKGERCFVLATGPSIAEQDVAQLAGEHVIAVNEMFDYLPQRGLVPEHVILHDGAYFSGERREAFLRDLEAASRRLGFHVLASIRGARAIAESGRFEEERLSLFSEGGALLAWREAGREPPLDFTRTLPGLYSVTHAALAFAIWRGFSEISVMGVDLDYAFDGTAQLTRCYGESRYNDHATISAAEAFRRDLGWSMDDVRAQARRQIEAFEFLAELAAARGIRVWDATAKERLGAIPKRDFRAG